MARKMENKHIYAQNHSQGVHLNEETIIPCLQHGLHLMHSPDWTVVDFGDRLVRCEEMTYPPAPSSATVKYPSNCVNTQSFALGLVLEFLYRLKVEPEAISVIPLLNVLIDINI